jgi:hypothetical protein
MAYAMHNPVEEAKPGRPLPVLLAVGLMVLMAIVGVIGAIASFAASATVIDDFRIRALAKGVLVSEVDDFATVLRAGLIGIGLVTLLISLVLIGLAFGVLQGNNPSRIATWVLSGLGVLCGCCGLCNAFGTAFGGADVTVDGTEPSSTLLTEAMIEALPAWYSGITGGSAGLQTLGYIATAVLLALPAANAYFRKRPQTWQPPAAGYSPQPPPDQPYQPNA